MLINIPNTTVQDHFLQPLRQALATNPNRRHCPELSDELFVHMGVERLLQEHPSTRALLQTRCLHDDTPLQATYLAALQSPRRLALLNHLHDTLADSLPATLPDQLAHIPELNRYQCHVIDGHWHEHATHDPLYDGRHAAVGHLYSYDLRRRTLRHLQTARGQHEADTSQVKRLGPRRLRLHTPKGCRTLLIEDRGFHNFHLWQRCRREQGIYHLTLAKTNNVFHDEREQPIDRNDPRNSGVLRDVLCSNSGEERLRRIEYCDPLTGHLYTFLTNDTDLPPGVLVELYRLRWSIEKVFDEVKNKLGQQKAWASGEVARTHQACFIALMHNLLMAYEWRLEEQHQIRNAAEDRRREQRRQQAHEQCRKNQTPLSPLVHWTLEATQCSVKLLRWLRAVWNQTLAETTFLHSLMHLYAQL